MIFIDHNEHICYNKIMETQKKDFYSVKEFADFIGKHPISVRRAIKSNRINAIRIGLGPRASYRIPASEINRIGICDLEKIVSKLVDERIGK